MAEKQVTLAAVTGAHGVTGEVRLKLFGEGVPTLSRHNSFNDGALTLKKLTDDGKGGAIARFAEVPDRTAAEALRGTALTVSRSALPALDEGEYYHADLLGLPAVSDEGAHIGIVVAIENFGAGDVIEIEKPDGKRFMVPMNATAVPEWTEAQLVVAADLPTNDLRRHGSDPLPRDVPRTAGRIAGGPGAGRGGVVLRTTCRSAISRPTSTTRSTIPRRAAGPGWCSSPMCSPRAVDHALEAHPDVPGAGDDPARKADHPGAHPRAGGGPRRHHFCAADSRVSMSGFSRAGRSRKSRSATSCFRAASRRRSWPSGRLHSPASRRNGRAFQRDRGELRTRGCSNIRTIPGLSNGKGARSLKCCDRGIMRRSKPGANSARATIHGHAGRTFGSATMALGTDLPLARGDEMRNQGR